jgi:type II secretory pathway pseudopilin PulG
MQKTNQKGAALIIFAVVFALAATAFLISQLDGNFLKNERQKRTAFVLSEAKAALIGYALKSGTLTGSDRPGDLPCPDTNHDGSSEPSCPGNAIGRLPWRTLGLADLRDEYDETLWYAVSANFKRNPKLGKLNSDTNGTITLRDTTGTITRNGATENAAIAVVVSPGNSLTRQDGVVQNRTEANFDNALHYLDNFDSVDNSKDEDNSSFVESNTNGFISGLIKDASNTVTLNDRIIVISTADLMPSLEKRVANEVKKRLNSLGGLPWAAPFTNPTISSNNFASVNTINRGLLPVYPHYWFTIDLSSTYITHTGNVSFSDVKSGFLEPGFCGQSGTQIVCNSRKQIMVGTDKAWLDQAINITGTLNANNSFASAPMIGSLTVTKTRISDGATLGTGVIIPTPNTKISITPTRSINFPEWLTVNNWHHEIYYAVANPFVYSAAIPPICGACLSVNYNGDVIANVGAIVLAAGKRLNATAYQPLIAQNRPSGNLYDYYDTLNNQAAGVSYDWNRTSSKTFNDQLVVVAP